MQPPESGPSRTNQIAIGSVDTAGAASLHLILAKYSTSCIKQTADWYKDQGTLAITSRVLRGGERERL